MLSKFFGLLNSSIVVPGEDGQLIEYDTLADYTLSEEYASMLAGEVPSATVVALCAVLALVCIALTVIILMQKKRASGIGAALSGSNDTYWSKNKGKSIEGTLERYTKWGAVAFMLIALVINVLG